MRKIRIEKVVCYIVAADHLLTFKHLDVPLEETGVQVPAGTIKAQEDPAVAALREAQKETGLPGLRVVRKLGERAYDISPYRFEILQRHFFELSVDRVDLDATWVVSEPDSDGSESPPRWVCS